MFIYCATVVVDMRKSRKRTFIYLVLVFGLMLIGGLVWIAIIAPQQADIGVLLTQFSSDNRNSLCICLIWIPHRE